MAAMPMAVAPLVARFERGLHHPLPQAAVAEWLLGDDSLGQHGDGRCAEAAGDSHSVDALVGADEDRQVGATANAAGDVHVADGPRQLVLVEHGLDAR